MLFFCYEVGPQGNLLGEKIQNNAETLGAFTHAVITTQYTPVQFASEFIAPR